MARMAVILVAESVVLSVSSEAVRTLEDVSEVNNMTCRPYNGLCRPEI
jgi:hypothetical protein